MYVCIIDSKVENQYKSCNLNLFEIYENNTPQLKLEVTLDKIKKEDQIDSKRIFYYRRGPYIIYIDNKKFNQKVVAFNLQ